MIDLSAPCIPWRGRISRDGYGTIGRSLAHRRVYQKAIGPIPDGLTIDHLCRVRHCVNPAHLEPVTRGENALRGIGPTAQNARKVACSAGHPFDEANTYVLAGVRRCRRCNAQRVNEYRARKVAVPE